MPEGFLVRHPLLFPIGPSVLAERGERFITLMTKQLCQSVFSLTPLPSPTPRS
jgi:hypothetical protein